MKQDQRFKRGNRPSKRKFKKRKGFIQQLGFPYHKNYAAFLSYRNRVSKAMANRKPLPNEPLFIGYYLAL